MNRSTGRPDKKIISEVEYERNWRLLMDSTESDQADRVFRKALALCFPPGSASSKKIVSAWKFVSVIDYRHGNTSSRIYLNHPLRVATILLTHLPSVSEETIIIALLHNVLEVSSITIQEINDRFGSQIGCAVQALTIERGRKDKKYLGEYYSRIESISPGCAAVKAADKLDNIYMICFNPSQSNRNSYLDDIDERVIPLASRTAPAIEYRIRKASGVMRELGFLDMDREWKKQERRYQHEK